jgi:signal transduction histidine kinase
MSIIKITGLSFWLLGCCLLLQGQSAYHIQRFTTDNGLPSNGIKGLQWDAQTGFLWIATEAGVARFNGADLLLFNRANAPAMYSERMLFLLKTHDGRIFTSDETGDLFFVVRNELQFMGQTRLDTRPATFRLTGLAASGRLFRQSSMQAPPDFGFNWLREQLVPMDEGRLVFTHNDTLYDYRLGNPVPAFVTTLDPGSKVFGLDDTIFIFNQKGCFRLDQHTRQKIAIQLTGWSEAEKKATLYWDDGMKEPILVNGHDAWILDRRDGKLEPTLICDAMPVDGLVSFVKYDRPSGMLFAGTQSKGIIVIRKDLIKPLRKKDLPADEPTAYYSQIDLMDGRILTSSGHVLGEERNGSIVPLPVSKSFNNFVLNEDSLLWYSREDTAYVYSRLTRKTSLIRPGSGSITDGFARSEDSMYMANAIGIGVLRGDTVAYQYRYPQANINSNVPFAMEEIAPGRIAIATCQGLFRFSVSDQHLDTLLKMPGICVRALWKFRDYLFIGTYGRGIWLYKDGKIRPIPIDKRGYLQYAHCFVPDKLGYCWISTNRGLFRARPEEMTRAFDRSTDQIAWHYYGREDGMDMTELNGGCTPCALRLNDSTLSFPSMDGLVQVNPSQPVPRFPEGSVFVDRFMADSQQVNVASLIRPVLPAGTRDLSFNLAFAAWKSKENLSIEYKLQPYSADWEALDLTHSPELRFSNLPYGYYELLVRHSNGAGNGTPVLAAFYIQPHWYQQSWSWLLALCLIAILIMLIVWWRTRQYKFRQNKLETQITEKTHELQVKNEELEKTDLIKTRLISIISHDLVTPLRFLHLTGKNLVENKNGLQEALRHEAIAEMATTSKELELLSTNILNWIKYQNEDRRLAKESFDVHEMVTQLFGILGAMARQKNIRLINRIEEGLIVYQYIEPVKIVLYNLILNGINFTSAGHIQVSSEPFREGITLSIEDTGVGMTQEQINNIMADHFIISSANVDNRKGNGLGYLIVKDLLKIMRASISIHSEKEKGTTVTVRVAT